MSLLSFADRKPQHMEKAQQKPAPQASPRGPKDFGVPHPNAPETLKVTPSGNPRPLMNPKVDTSGFSFDLSPPQKEVFLKVKEILRDELTQPYWHDFWVLRFCRARQFDIDQVVLMIRNNIKWRKEVGADTILERMKTNKFWPISENYWPGRLHGSDYWGTIVYYERVGLIDLKGLITQIPEKDLLELHIARMEDGERMRMEVYKNTGRYPEEGCLIVQDLRGLSFKHMYSPALGIFKKFAAMDSDNYPEGLLRLYFVNAPSVFTMIWSICKSVMDKKTADKMQLTGGSYLELLRSEIPDENIPTYLGGGCTRCPNGCVPEAGPFNSPVVYTEVTVSARNCHDHVVKVEKGGALITWEFKTDSYDIGFALLQKKDGKLKEVIECQRFKSDTTLVRDQYQVKHGEIGEYVVRFDNSHSMMRKKTLKYEVVVENPPEDLPTISP